MFLDFYDCPHCFNYRDSDSVYAEFYRSPLSIKVNTNKFCHFLDFVDLFRPMEPVLETINMKVIEKPVAECTALSRVTNNSIDKT